MAVPLTRTDHLQINEGTFETKVKLCPKEKFSLKTLHISLYFIFPYRYAQTRLACDISEKETGQD